MLISQFNAMITRNRLGWTYADYPVTSGRVKSDINIESAALQLTSYVQGFAVNGILAENKEEMIIATEALLTPLQV